MNMGNNYVMTEFLYDKSSLVIALVLMLLMALALQAGNWLGKRSNIKDCEPCKEQISTVQSSLLGILALMLGFAFSIALERYSSRSDAVLEEANAIGTTYLRTELLAEPYKPQAQSLLADYIHSRLEEAQLNMAEQTQRGEILKTSERLQQQLWQLAAQATKVNPSPVTSGLFTQSLNEMIDAYGKRISELERHIPELVLLMLYGAFLITGSIIGYSAGLSNRNPSKAVYIMALLVALLMYLVIDLDRPRRGLVQVSQQPMLSLQSMLPTPK